MFLQADRAASRLQRSGVSPGLALIQSFELSESQALRAHSYRSDPDGSSFGCTAM